MNENPTIITAALPMELADIRALGSFNKSSLDSGVKYFLSVLHGKDVALFVSGIGEESAYRTAKAACQSIKPKAYICVGLSAALDASLHPGDVVIASAVCSADSPGAEYPCDAGLLDAAKVALGSGARTGLLLASKRVLVTAEEKRKCATLSPLPTCGGAGGEGALAVDMESFGAARACAEAGVPFLAIRAISDSLDEDLPVDFNPFMKDGRMDWPRFIIYLLAHPGKIPALMRLGRHSRLAAKNLGLSVDSILARL